MHFLIFLLVPAAFVYHLAGYRDAGIEGKKTGYLAGIAAGICAVIVNGILSHIFPPATPHFIVKLASIIFSETVIPFILAPLALFYLAVSPEKERFAQIKLHLFGIASVYLPYIMITRYDYPDLAVIAGVPILVLSFLFLAEYCLRQYVASVNRATDLSDFAMAVLPAFVMLIASDLYKTLWYFCFPFWVWLPLFLAIPLLALYTRLRAYGKLFISF
jgi:MFS family permease